MKGAATCGPFHYSYISNSLLLPFIFRHTTGEECDYVYLRYLPARNIVGGPEIRSIDRRHARLTRPTARVTRYRVAIIKPLDVVKECRPSRHILEYLRPCGLRPPRR